MAETMMVERVARALCRATGNDPDFTGYQQGPADDARPGWQRKAGQAQAALKASGHAEMVEALTQAEACMSIVAPRSDTAEYLRILGVVSSALAKATSGEEG